MYTACFRGPNTVVVMAVPEIWIILEQSIVCYSKHESLATPKQSRILPVMPTIPAKQTRCPIIKPPIEKQFLDGTVLLFRQCIYTVTVGLAVRLSSPTRSSVT